MKWAEEIMDFVAQMIDFVLQLMNLFAQNTYDKPWSFYLGIYGCCFALGTPQHTKMVAFVLNMVAFVLKMFDFVLKMMDFVLRMFDFVLKMFDFVLKMFVLRVRPAGRLPRLADREHSLRKTQEMRLPLKTICFPEETMRFNRKHHAFPLNTWVYHIEYAWHCRVAGAAQGPHQGPISIDSIDFDRLSLISELFPTDFWACHCVWLIADDYECQHWLLYGQPHWSVAQPIQPWS